MICTKENTKKGDQVIVSNKTHYLFGQIGIVIRFLSGVHGIEIEIGKSDSIGRKMRFSIYLKDLEPYNNTPSFKAFIKSLDKI